jgi:ABC-type Fe3+/spermidine/putrescine transport system ATPase subunit
MAKDAGAGDPMVRFEKVQKSYDGETLVVKDLNLDIAKGEFLTMLGPSGSGKTTCLMMLAGFEPATNGEIYLNGNPINNVPPHKRGIGMVFQNYALFPHMSVAENLAFPLSVRGMSKSEQEERRSSGCWRWSSCHSAAAARRSCPVASSSVSPWRARWCSIRTSC